jgi:hypothetical protein
MDEIIEQPAPSAIPDPQPMRYVTYLDDGTLDGCFLQVPPGEHVARMIPVDEVIAGDWVHFHANGARDGVEMVVLVPPAASIVPQKVTRRQARQALLLAGLLDDVPLAIAALDDGTPEGKQKMRLAQIEWEDSLEFERSRPLVVEIGHAIGLNAEQMDALFVTAAGL